jgi:ABC-type transport system substrate-binding protein
VLWHSGQAEVGQNYGGMDDGYLSNLLAQARTDPNGLHRKAHYDAFQEAFTSRAPALVLYYPIFVYATDLRLQGVQLDFISTPSDRFRTIQDWHFGG